MKLLALVLLLALPASGGMRGIASWYSVASNGGRTTASGHPLHDHELVAAHRHLPFGTRLLVRCDRTGRAVTVKVIDRGPFVRGRIIDLSVAAARALGFHRRGLTPVTLKIVE